MPLPTASAEPVLPDGRLTTNDTEVNPSTTATAAPDRPNDNESESPPKGPPLVPASSGNKNASVPVQPTQGAVAAALRPFMASARKCVVGASDASRVTILFESEGSISRIDVGGWAKANGAAGCITSALGGANVGRFWKPSFRVTYDLQP